MTSELIAEGQRVMRELQERDAFVVEDESAPDVEAFAPAEDVVFAEENYEPARVDPVEDLAAQVSSRLELATVDLLLARNRDLELECQALRRVTADAVIAAREAVALSSFAPRIAYDEPKPRRRWFRRGQ